MQSIGRLEPRISGQVVAYCDSTLPEVTVVCAKTFRHASGVGMGAQHNPLYSKTRSRHVNTLFQLDCIPTMNLK